MVLGSIVAPGGTIAITPQYAWIGEDAVLDVAGTFVRDPRVTAYSTGTVLPGGSITLSGAAVVALAGSVFDISGASATIDVPAAGSGYRRTWHYCATDVE